MVPPTKPLTLLHYHLSTTKPGRGACGACHCAAVHTRRQAPFECGGRRLRVFLEVARFAHGRHGRPLRRARCRPCRPTFAPPFARPTFPGPQCSDQPSLDRSSDDPKKRRLAKPSRLDAGRSLAPQPCPTRRRYTPVALATGARGSFSRPGRESSCGASCSCRGDSCQREHVSSPSGQVGLEASRKRRRV